MRAGQREGNGCRENLKNAGEIRGLTCELQTSQTLSRAFKTFKPQNGFCVSLWRRAAELRTSRMVPLCAECLWTVAELMDTTQEQAWNQFRRPESACECK